MRDSGVADLAERLSGSCPLGPIPESRDKGPDGWDPDIDVPIPLASGRPVGCSGPIPVWVPGKSVQRLRSGPAHERHRVVEGDLERLHGPGVADLAERLGGAASHILNRVLEGCDEGLDSLWVADLAERFSSSTAHSRALVPERSAAAARLHTSGFWSLKITIRSRAAGGPT